MCCYFIILTEYKQHVGNLISIDKQLYLFKYIYNIYPWSKIGMPNYIRNQFPLPYNCSCIKNYAGK